MKQFKHCILNFPFKNKVNLSFKLYKTANNVIITANNLNLKCNHTVESNFIFSYNFFQTCPFAVYHFHLVQHGTTPSPSTEALQSM